jgi:hypothetical protein
MCWKCCWHVLGILEIVVILEGINHSWLAQNGIFVQLPILIRLKICHTIDK